MYISVRAHTHTVPPRITSSFPQTTVNRTLPVSLSCRSEGTPPLQWTWKRDTQTLSNNGAVSFTTSGAESTLTISSVSVNDGGVYQCVVEQPSTGLTAAANELLFARGKSTHQSVRPSICLVYKCVTVFIVIDLHSLSLSLYFTNLQTNKCMNTRRFLCIFSH